MTFTFTRSPSPARPSPQVLILAAGPRQSRAETSRRILVANDEPGMPRFVREALS